MKFRTGAASFALALMTAASAAQGQQIVGAVGGTINSGGPGDGDLANTWNQAGLSPGYISGVTDFNAYIAGNPMHSWGFVCCEWFSNGGTTSASVTYDLGVARDINALALWNEDASGIGTLDLYSSVDGVNFSALSLGLRPIDNAYFADYPAEVFNLSSTLFRYVRFDMSNCPQNAGDYQACAIGEVAFRTASTVPEPGTFALMLSGLVGVGMAVRRRRSV